MSEPMFAPNTEEEMQNKLKLPKPNGQQSNSKRVEEDKTRETSSNTNIVEVLMDVKLFFSRFKATIHIKGSYSTPLKSTLLSDRNI